MEVLIELLGFKAEGSLELLAMNFAVVLKLFKCSLEWQNGLLLNLSMKRSTNRTKKERKEP